MSDPLPAHLSRLHASVEASAIEVQTSLTTLLALIDDAKTTLNLAPLAEQSPGLVESVRQANVQLASNATQFRNAVAPPARELGLGPPRSDEERAQIAMALAAHFEALPDTQARFQREAGIAARASNRQAAGRAALDALRGHVVEPALEFLAGESADPAALRIRDGLVLNQSLAAERDWAAGVAAFERFLHGGGELPLSTALRAGACALEDVAHYRALVGVAGDLAAQAELPLYVEPPAHFHSVFSCPVSREEAAWPANPPVLLSCGHVIATTSMTRLARNRQRFKCPTCPSSDETVEGALKLFL